MAVTKEVTILSKVSEISVLHTVPLVHLHVVRLRDLSQTVQTFVSPDVCVQSFNNQSPIAVSTAMAN
jgi:hypothetical protein